MELYEEILTDISLLEKYLDEFKLGDERKIRGLYVSIIITFKTQLVNLFMSTELTIKQLQEMKLRLNNCDSRMRKLGIITEHTLIDYSYPSSSIETRCLRCHKKGI